jgi:hypothetical protein
MPNFDIIQKEIKELLRKKLVNGKILLQDCKLIDENSRRSPSYSDPLYVPFYYHLGKFIKPKSVLSLSFNLGLLEKCFFMSCLETEYFLAFHQTDENVYFSNRMGFYNIRKSYKKDFDFFTGDMKNDDFHDRIGKRKWDAIFINEEKNYDYILYMLEISWEYLSDDGCIIIDNALDLKPVKQAYLAFADSVGVKPNFFETRYGTGILFKQLLI